MFDVKRMLRLTGVDSAVEISTAEDGVSEIVVIKECEDRQFITKVMESAGYHLTDGNSETAAFGILEFTNEPLFSNEDDIETANFGDDDEDDDGIENEVADVENDRHGISGNERASADDLPIDGNGRSFVVLVDGEAHKFANKIFTQMLNNEDMSVYGAFLYDLDNFLRVYRGPPPETDEDEDDEDTIDKPAGDKISKAEDKDAPEAESASVAEVASILFGSRADEFHEAFKKYLPPEIASNKVVINLILGIVFKIIVGSLGKALLTAWAMRDKGRFEGLLYSIVNYIVKDYFPMSESEQDTYSRYYDDYRNSTYSGSTIDLDDYETASAELVGIDIEAMEEASIGSKMLIRIVMAVMTKALSGYIGNRVVEAWINKDGAAFKKSMTPVIDFMLGYFPKDENASIVDEDLKEVEVARKKKQKNGRGAMLSALMKALSGDTGDKAARAWDAGDPELLGEVLGNVAEKVLNAMPVDEEKYGDDDEAEEEQEENTVTDAEGDESEVETEGDPADVDDGQPDESIPEPEEVLSDEEIEEDSAPDEATVIDDGGKPIPSDSDPKIKNDEPDLTVS